MSLKQHSLFQNKPKIATKTDIIENHIIKHGDKIIVDIPLSNITSTPQVRKHFNEIKIKQLAEDIDTKGLIHPITVMKDPNKRNNYILLIGGNRFLAAKYLNWDCVPCIVKAYNKNDSENELIQLAENMHRQDLNPIELAEAIIRIKNRSNFTLAQLAKALGRNIDSIKQYSRINKLSETEKKFHLKQKSTKNEILGYLASKDKPKTQANKTQKESLFNEYKANQYENLTPAELSSKIKEAEEFLKIAKKLMKEKK